MGVHAGVVFAFFYAPIAILIIFSFSGDRLVGRWGGFTLDWYREFWNNDQLTNSITVSLQVALIATVASVVLGTLSALALERFRFRGRRVFDALLYLPIIIPDVTMGIMMLVFFAEGIDVVDSLLGISLAKGITTITLSHIAFCISFVSVVVRARLSGMDSRLEEAAMDLYATRWQTFRYVTLPQILPGVAGGGLLALTLSLDDVVISQFTSGPGATTLPVYVFSLIRKGVTPMINSVSVVMFLASLVLIAAMLAVDRLRSTGSSVPSAVPGGDLSAEPAVGGHERGDT
ncbi:MAG: ABC transporter permease [Actinobacteria bacterium]|nr:ABC transporter permease [Actinomycetota bacterium]